MIVRPLRMTLTREPFAGNEQIRADGECDGEQIMGNFIQLQHRRRSGDGAGSVQRSDPEVPRRRPCAQIRWIQLQHHGRDWRTELSVELPRLFALLYHRRNYYRYISGVDFYLLCFIIYIF